MPAILDCQDAVDEVLADLYGTESPPVTLDYTEASRRYEEFHTRMGGAGPAEGACLSEAPPACQTDFDPCV